MDINFFKDAIDVVLMRQGIDSVESRLRYEKDRSRKILNTSHRPDKKCTSKIIYHCILSHLRPDEEKENFYWIGRKQKNFLCEYTGLI